MTASGVSRPNVLLLFNWQLLAHALVVPEQRAAIAAMEISCTAAEADVISRARAALARAPAGWLDRLAAFGAAAPSGPASSSEQAAKALPTTRAERSAQMEAGRERVDEAVAEMTRQFPWLLDAQEPLEELLDGHIWTRELGLALIAAIVPEIAVNVAC